MAARGTRATQQPTKLGIAYKVHSYSNSAARYGTDTASYGAQAAAVLGVAPGRVFGRPGAS